MVQCAWRRYLAMEELKFKKKEVVMAKKIQGNYRCHLGRLALEEKRRVSQCEVLDSSGDLSELFDASKILDKDPDTFWCSGAQGEAPRGAKRRAGNGMIAGVIRLS